MSSLSLSPSKIRTYQRCALQYRLQSEGPPPAPGGAPASPELAVDRALHDALDRYHAELLRGEAPGAERLVELLAAAWPSGAFASEALAAEALEQASARLRRFHAVQSASSASVVAGKTFVTGYPAGVKVTSVVDRVDRLPGGALELIDFKSGKPPRPGFDLARDAGARLVYALAAADRKLQRHGSPVRFTQWYLQNQQRVSAEFDAEQLARVDREVAAVAEGIERGEFPPARGPHCSFCEQLERCPAWSQLPRELASEDAQTFARRLRASYSKLSQYKSCPRAYRMIYVERCATAEKPFFDLGKAVHATLERFHAADYGGDESLDALLGLYEQAFAEHQAGYRTEAEREEYHRRGREMIQAYWRSHVEPHGRQAAHSIEEYFELPLGARTVLTGFIDRIDRAPDGRLTVWDYKTEATMRSQEEVDEDLQLGIYAWACRQLYGQDVELGLYMLAHDAVLRTRRSAEQLEAVEREVDELAGRIQADTEFAPTINRHCPDCDFLEDCPKRDEVRDLLERGELRRAGFAAPRGEEPASV